MKKLKKIKNRGLVIWITGLPGSGKTSIAKKIKEKINKNFGSTIVISGDDFRNIFNLKNYSRNGRIKVGKSYGKFCKFFSDKGVNVVFAAVGLFNEIRSFNRKNIKNYVEIYVKSNISKIKKIGKKKLYFKNKKNLVGVDIKPEFPKNPHIIIKNDFKKSIKTLTDEAFSKLIKLF